MGSQQQNQPFVSEDTHEELIGYEPNSRRTTLLGLFRVAESSLPGVLLHSRGSDQNPDIEGVRLTISQRDAAIPES